MNNPVSRLVRSSSKPAYGGLAPRHAAIATAGIAGAIVLAVGAFAVFGGSTPEVTKTATVAPESTQPAAPVKKPAQVKQAASKTPQPQQKSAEAKPVAKPEKPTARNQMTAPETTLAAKLTSSLPPLANAPVPAVDGVEIASTSAAVPLREAASTGLTEPASERLAIPDGLRGTVDVQVAESEAEVAMLETSTGMTDETAPAPDTATVASVAPNSAEPVVTVEPQAAARTPVQAPTGPLPALKPAKSTQAVKLRAGPADEAGVITILPANAAIQAEADCQWCTVVYNGKRGYIYKNFIRRSAAEEAAAGQGLF
ncbi:SH3 domain-containing protein [Oryzicola mucosus]|uniref:SH3 domain-containing protein n=1 Tax=Oryzicola mucosus TaxID=2767425 RepID=A0A8J6Q0U4_9HYPH|nr:SH3 domain-containing protein [Oryzicola mucosus]MBD0414185.1 hypothetical protein [Oryzicola mucosus]